MKFKHIKQLKRTSDNIVLLATGESINDITPEQWKWIKEQDSMAMNNFVYHPTFIPDMNHLEIKAYDFEYQKKYLTEKWEMGWKDVKFIFQEDRADFIAGCIPSRKNIFVYEQYSRGYHPSLCKNPKIDANFDPLRYGFKICASYDASTSKVIHILYLMGYVNIIIFGMTIYNRKYFWTDWNIDVHDKWNKQRENRDIDTPHNASHMKDYIIDFNERHMLPYGREIWVGDMKTALYPSLRLWDRYE